MSGEEAIDDADVVADENAERETEHAGTYDQASIQPSESVSRKRERKRDHGGDQHHSCDCANSEDQQIKNSPLWVVNRAQHEQRDCG